MIALASVSEVSRSAALPYGMAYLVMSALIFVVIGVIVRAGGRTRIEDLGGLWKRSPRLALLLLVALFGLAGIPPTSGFTGKWFVFTATLQKGQFLLLLIAALTLAAGIYPGPLGALAQGAFTMPPETLRG